MKFLGALFNLAVSIAIIAVGIYATKYGAVPLVFESLPHLGLSTAARSAAILGSVAAVLVGWAILFNMIAKAWGFDLFEGS